MLSRVPALLITLFIIVCSGCTPTQTAPLPTPRTCGPFVVPPEAYLACAAQKNGLLIQTQPNETVALTGHKATWALAGTGLYLSRADSLTETLITLEGTALVSANGSTRIVPAGAQVVLSLDDTGAIRSVSPQPLPYESALIDVKLLAQLPRSLGLPTPIAPPEGYAAQSIRPAGTACAGGCGLADAQGQCVIHDEWEEARVKAGETLSLIAARYGLSAADLQQANCLNNPNRLQVGQILRVPPYPTATPYAQATFTPSLVAFRADTFTLTVGECTMLRWDVQNVSAIFLDEQPTVSSGVLPICPQVNTTYTLRVVYPDGTQTQYPLLISVAQSAPS